jgi:hypothetical protein
MALSASCTAVWVQVRIQVCRSGSVLLHTRELSVAGGLDNLPRRCRSRKRRRQLERRAGGPSAKRPKRNTKAPPATTLCRARRAPC